MGIFEGIDNAIFGGSRQEIQRQRQQQDFNNELRMVRTNPTPENVARLQQNPMFKEFVQRQIPKMRAIQSVSKDDLDQIKKLQAIKDAAEGQYFGIKGGPTKRLDEKTYNWASKQIESRTKSAQEKPGKTSKTKLGRVADKASAFLAGPQEAPSAQPRQSRTAGYMSPLSEGPKESYDLTGERLPDYFQVSTPFSSQQNIPKTYDDIGVDSPQDIQTMQEMQKAAPDVDMRREYQDDPEGMKRLMELWRQGKLNKANILKAFAAIQQSAKQALGIA